MADVSYIEKINNTKLFAERAGYSRSGKNLDAMVTKVAGATTGNLVSFDANGDFADSHQAAANLVHDASYVHTDNNFTDAEQTKLSGIATGAQVNVIEDVKVNGTSQTVTNKTVDITVPVGGTADPAMDGTASAGSATTWSKSDHVHPTDTSREATANKDSSIPASPVSSHYPSTEAVVQFVNSSVSTNTANFLGTYDVVTDLELTTSATNAQIASALNSYTFPSGTTVTNNDYVFVSINLETTTDVDEYRRFKYSDGTPSGSWAYEYTLNNSSFTQAQWDAINSAITSTKVGNYDTHIANTNNPHGVTKAQVGLGSVGNFLAVSTDANQGLTDTQKVNARANIGAGTYSKPTNGIPSTDMESTVQTSLVLAATAYQKPSGGIPDSDIESAPTWNGKQDSLGINSSTGDAAKFLNERGQFVATSVSVSDNNPTLSWGATSKVGTVGSTDLRVTMPSNPASGKADNIPTFTEASTRVNLNGSNETMPTILGKVKKWFTDLKALAFKATVGTSDIDNDAITAAKVKDNETLPVNVSGNAASASSVAWANVSGKPSTYTPSAHAESTGSYGKGTKANYGHVQLLNGDLNGKTYTDGVAAASAHTHSQYLTSHQNISGKADKVSGSVNGLLAALDANGNLANSGISARAVDATVSVIGGKQDQLPMSGEDTYAINISGKATKDGAGNTISSTYLKLSGGTMTGSINAIASMSADDAVTNGINMNNSNIVNVNSIYTADTSDSAGEGIHFYRDSTHYDSLWMNGGNIYFTPNRALGTLTTAANSKKVAVLPASFSSGKAIVTDGTSGSIKTVNSVPQADYATSAGSATDAFKKSTSGVVYRTLSDFTPSSTEVPIENFEKANRITMAFFYIKNSSQSSTCNFKISLKKISDSTTVLSQNINLAAYQLTVVPLCFNTSDSSYDVTIVQITTTVTKLYIKSSYVHFRY